MTSHLSILIVSAASWERRHVDAVSYCSTRVLIPRGRIKNEHGRTESRCGNHVARDGRFMSADGNYVSERDTAVAIDLRACCLPRGWTYEFQHASLIPSCV